MICNIKNTKLEQSIREPNRKTPSLSVRANKVMRPVKP